MSGTAELLEIPEFRFESGDRFREVPVAYQTWGRLNESRDNAVLVCHALTGNTDVAAWWGELLGSGRALDPDRDFVICLNVIGSPYGTLSPLSIDPTTGERYGPSFPIPTVRDTVRLHKRALKILGVERIRFAVGGSMGGMQVLEWGFYGEFVTGLVPIAVGGRHSAWCIAWSEAQRRAIVSDSRWSGGRYGAGEGPAAGLATARMMAMISYRSFASFETRFGREPNARSAPVRFAMESYLHYQGEKLVSRFDANCYIRLTESMDTHDVARGRGEYPAVLSQLRQPALVIGIDSDVLYPLVEQEELVSHMPNAELAVLDAPHGHDSFLIDREAVNELILSWRRRRLRGA